MAPRVEAQVAARDTPGSIRSECNHGPDIDRHKYRGPLAGAISPIATMVANATSGSSLRRGADRVHYPTLCVQVAPGDGSGRTGRGGGMLFCVAFSATC